MGRSHKKENTFKFRTFSERLGDVQIDVTRRTTRLSDVPDDADTFFAEALQKWSELNRTQHFVDFRADVRDMVQSLAQVVHHKDMIVDLIVRHLSVEASHASAALMDLMVQLARDLQQDFYPYFNRCFSVLVGHILTPGQSVELLDAAFTSLSFLFKILWREMVHDMASVLHVYAPLFSLNKRLHIKRFAAESIAFVMRKVKSRDQLFEQLFSRVENNEHEIESCGLVLFEMLKGVKNQLHSCTEQALSCLLPKLKSDRLVRSVEIAYKSLLDHADADHIQVVWQATLMFVERTLKQACDDVHQMALVSGLSLLRILVEDGSQTMRDSGTLTRTLISVFRLPYDATCHSLALDILTSLLMKRCLMTEQIHELITGLFKANFTPGVIYSFIQSVVTAPCFEQNILHLFLGFCHDQAEKSECVDDELMMVLCRLLVEKCPIHETAVTVQKPYILDFSGKVRRKKTRSWIGSHLMKVVDERINRVGETDSEARVWAALMILPNIRPLPENCAKLTVLLERLMNAESRLTVDAAAVLYQCALALDQMTALGDALNIDQLVGLVRESGRLVNVLRTADLYITRLSDTGSQLLGDEAGSKVLKYLKSNLSSYDRNVRLLTVRILSKFAFTLPEHHDDNVEQVSVFKICLMAESVPLSVSDYRNKLFHLSKLEHAHVQRQLPANGEAYDVPLKFLLGSLYNNFSLLWLPLRTMIETHAHGMPETQFWPVYAEQLEYLARVNEEKREVQQRHAHIDDFDDLFRTRAADVTVDRPDHGLVRYHLWKSMQQFPRLVETKSKTICPLLFRFLENEYYLGDMNSAPSQDLRKVRDDDFDEMEETDFDDEDISESREIKTKSAKKKTPLIKFLIAHLEIFSKFKSPKSLTMEAKLLDLYYRLLAHRYQNIQQVALNCLMTYKLKYLLPYRESLSRLLDDSKFKDEIVMFSLSEDNTTIVTEHREKLIPILMRLLYGRMISKTGKETSGKQNAALRKTLVLRFLGGCHPEELRVFIDLVFGAFKDYYSDDLSSKVAVMLANVDASCVIPIRQQQSALHTLDVVFTNLGNSIGAYLQEFFHIITCITAVSIRLLEQRETLFPQAINSLKTLKTLGLTRILQFFSLFGSYSFSESDVAGLFLGVVCPLMEKLPNEGHYSPTLLLKLVHIWSTEPGYLPMLERGNSHTSVLDPVFKLLLSRTVHASVTSFIMEIVDNLLSCSLNDELVQDRAVEAGPGVPLLIPHIPTLITYLHGVVKSMTGRGTRKFALPVKEMRILARLSIHVTDSTQCKAIARLLIPFLARGGAKDESMELDVLASVNHLLMKCDFSEDLFWPLAKLFSVINGRQSRSALCDVITGVVAKCPEREQMANVVAKLNAWDRRRVDEVDYDKRLDGYVQVNDYIRDAEAVDAIYLAFVVHNAAYFLRTTEDMALRDSASNCLHVLVERLQKKDMGREDYQSLVEGNLLPQIRSGLKVPSETPRNEFIKILALCVRAFPHNKVLFPLTILMNEEDREVDVFMNLTHIQMHRRGRAMRRMIQLLPQAGLSAECLSLYVLPIVSHFLSEAYTKHPAVVDAAVDCVGAICKILPWSKYNQLLKSYLGQLTKCPSTQKILVKVIVSILDNFHFDIRPIDKHTDMAVAGDVGTEEMMTDGDGDDDDDNLEEKEKLKPNLVQQIHKDLLEDVVPRLKSALAKKAKSDDEHKMAKSTKYAEDEEILRVPIALALVKLLQQFPADTLKLHLPGVLLKVCEFLRSRARDVRDTARDTLTKILMSLGHTYFPFILSELQGTLKRGYQVHVMVYTVVALLNSMKPVLKCEMLDSSVPAVVNILNMELFGDLANEKEVEGITNKIHEAKAIKGYDGYEILATYVGKGMIGKLLLPLKEILDSTNSHKTNKKAEEILKRISAGLIENKDLDVDVMMIFIHGLIHDKLSSLKPKLEERKQEVKPGQQPPSTFLISKPEPRGGLKPKVDKKTNSNILLEFSLQLMHNLLKRSRLVISKSEHLQLLDQFVDVLTEALVSKHVRVIAWSIRCLTWILNAELPSLRANISTITSRLFLLLKNYCTGGAAHGDNQELVVSCFKALTILVRDVRYHKITHDQIRVLLLYVEEDIHDNNRQATAFSLLRAILIRQLVIPEMNEVMMKVCRLSVTSDSPQLRQRARQVILKFLMDYPLGKKVKGFLEFFVAQLTYEMEPGRESALEMMAAMFSSFPPTMMEAYCLLFFMPLTTRLINDESTRCRKLVSLALKSLLSRVSLTKRDEVMTMLHVWSRDSKPLHQQLAMSLIGILVEVERDKFERRLTDVLPLIVDRIQPDRFSDEVDDETKTALDKLLFSTLNALVKVLTYCPSAIRDQSYRTVMADMWRSVRNHLLYPHHWVRLAAAQLVGVLFSAWTVEELTDGVSGRDYFQADVETTLRGLTTDILKQFKDFSESELGDQIVKNLVFLARCARVFEDSAAGEEVMDDEKSRKLRLEWLIKKLSREATYEATQDVKKTLKRRCVYKWLAAVSADLGNDAIVRYLPQILPPLVRDTSDLMPNQDESLVSLANEVLDLVKSTAGVESFLRAYSDVQRTSSQRREERRREKLVRTVSNPELASRKRIKKNLQKRDAKKRKIDALRPTRVGKKRKLHDVVAVTDD